MEHGLLQSKSVQNSRKQILQKVTDELLAMDDEAFRCALEESKRSDLHHALMYGWDYNYVI
jgi:hypothetical protein